jgi:hypothetical protein
MAYGPTHNFIMKETITLSPTTVSIRETEATGWTQSSPQVALQICYIIDPAILSQSNGHP